MYLFDDRSELKKNFQLHLFHNTFVRAKWSVTVESSQCPLVAPQHDVNVLYFYVQTMGEKTCDRWLLRLLHWNLVLKRFAGINASANGNWPRKMLAIGRHCCPNLSISALDPADRNLKGKYLCYVHATLFHLCISWAAFGFARFTRLLIH